MAQSQLTQQVSTRTALAEFGYPAEALVVVFTNGDYTKHVIWGSGDANGAPGALYNNAPNGSVYIPDTATANDKKLYIKFGARGLADGTWSSIDID